MKECKEIDSALDVVLKLIHLPVEKMAGALADINKNLGEPEQAGNGSTIDKKIPAEIKVTSQEPVKEKPKKQEGVKTSDHPPCGECGGSFFLRTGTCHVCQTCGSSQGCS